MKVGFVEFGFLHAGSDDAHGRCERPGEFSEDFVKIKQQVQCFWPSARKRKLGFVIAFHHKVAAGCKGVQHSRHVLFPDGRRRVKPRAGDEPVMAVEKVSSHEIVHVIVNRYTVLASKLLTLFLPSTDRSNTEADQPSRAAHTAFRPSPSAGNSAAGLGSGTSSPMQALSQALGSFP